MWKDIIGFEGIYEINEYGDIRDFQTKKLRKYYINNKGYKMIDLHKDKSRVRMLVHRLVAIHFVSNPNNDPIVLHLDNNKLNTYYTNLKWGTYSENNSQAIQDGLNILPTPDNRKYYEIYNQNNHTICHGAKEVIEKLTYGNDSLVRNLLFRGTSVNQGPYLGFKIRKIEIQSPISFDYSLIK